MLVLNCNLTERVNSLTDHFTFFIAFGINLKADFVQNCPIQLQKSTFFYSYKMFYFSELIIYGTLHNLVQAMFHTNCRTQLQTGTL